MKDNNAQRRIAIIIAVILGILAAVYLGGLLGQLNAGYQKWLAEDGISGGVAMDPIRFDPLYCLAGAFTKDGLLGTLLVVVVTAVIVAYIKLNNRFSSNDFDDRNFTRSKKGTYGTAGWMTKKEMKLVLEITSPENAKGIILGQKDGSVICLPTETMLNKHLCVFGASGTMKSRAIVRPYLFQSIKRGDSVILTDPKSELYNDTAELFRQGGYKVRVFNLLNPEHSDSWNCMADLDGDTMMAQILTNVIISNTGKGKTDHFWDNGEGNLLKSLILYIDQDSTRTPESKHLPAVYQMLTQNTERSLSAIFDKLPISHPAKAPYNLFAQASDTVRAGIVLGLGTRLQVLQNEAIRKITSKSELDLSEPGKTKCAYFVILSDQESSTEFISSLFFSFLFIKLTRYADSTPEQRCKIPVNIVFEELNNVGQLDTYPRRLSVARSRAIQVCHVVQSLAQFKNRYPEEQWAEIVGNCDTQIMLGCTEEQTAEYFSARSGDMSVEVNSTMTVRQSIAIAQMIPQYRQTEGLGKRRLLTPDEVFRIPNKEMLIIIRGEKMLRAHKFDYTGHPYAKRMVKTSIFSYSPQDEGRFSQTETECSQPPEDLARSSPANKKPARRQTETRKRLNNPREKPQQLDTPKNIPFCQTETGKSLDELNSPGDRHAQRKEPVPGQIDSKKAAGAATESPARSGDTVQHSKKSAPRQTETERHLDEVISPVSTEENSDQAALIQNEMEGRPAAAEKPGYTALYQTGTENHRKPLETKSSERPPPQKAAPNQSESDIAPIAIQHAKKPTPHQTETEKHLARGDRRAAPDYTKLLDSFKQQPGKAARQPKTNQPPGIEKASRPDVEDSGVQQKKTAAHQTEYKLPLAATATQLVPDADSYTGPALYGDAKPPSDF